MAQRRFLHIVIVTVSITAIAPGCAFYRQGVLRARPVGVEGEKLVRNGVRLRLEGLTLSIQPQTAGGPIWGVVLPYFPVPVPFVSKGEHQDQLAIWIDLNPREGSVSFDSGEVTLRAENKEPLRAATILGPGVGGAPPEDALRCGRPAGFVSEQQQALPVEKRWIQYSECFNCESFSSPPDRSLGRSTVTHPTCFVLIFAVDPFADTKYLLSVEGIVRQGLPLRVPLVELVRGRVSGFESFGP